MNLFDGEDPSHNDDMDFLAEITKPGAKFDRTKYESDEDLLKALAKKAVISDRHISTIETENNEFRALNKRMSDESVAAQRLQELLDKMENTGTPQGQTPKPAAEDNKAVIDPNQIESLISSKLQQHEQTRKEQDNFNSVQSRVKEVFGDNSKQVLKQKADELGLSDDDVNRLARTNPNLFFKTFDLVGQGTQGFQAPPRSDVRADSFAPKGPEKRTMSYYQKLKRQNPNMLHDPQIRLQMDKDAVTLGSAFFDV